MDKSWESYQHRTQVVRGRDSPKHKSKCAFTSKIGIHNYADIIYVASDVAADQTITTQRVANGTKQKQYPGQFPSRLKVYCIVLLTKLSLQYIYSYIAILLIQQQKTELIENCVRVCKCFFSFSDKRKPITPNTRIMKEIFL